MALLDYIYNDVNLTDQFDDATDNLIAEAVNGSSGIGVFYIGTPTAGNKLQIADSEGTPGVDSITVSIVDSSVGSGVEASHIKLATTQGGLATATGGAALSAAVEIPYGAPQPIYLQWDNSVGSGSYTEISLSIDPMQEVAI